MKWLEYESMRHGIRIDREKCAIDASWWYVLVPNEYRNTVDAIVRNLLPDFSGKKLNERLLHEFVGRLHKALLAHLEVK